MNSAAAESWNRDQLRRQLQSMDDFDFEHLIADIWERQGWDAEVEQQSGDAGVDVRATKDAPYKQKVLIQAKRYSEDNTLGGPDIQQYAALKQQEANVDKAIVITTGRFTSSARDRAEDLNVKLIDGSGLVDLIEAHDAYDIVDEYITVPSPSQGESSEAGGLDFDDGDPYFKPDVRAELKEKLGENYEEHIKAQQYRATRAVEQAKARVMLNPHDASELGVFEGVDEISEGRNWEENKTIVALLKDNIHIDKEGEVFVEDLSDYVHHHAIRANHNKGIVGVIQRGVQDEAWAKDTFTAKVHVKNAKQSDGKSGGSSNLFKSITEGDSISKRLQSIAEGYKNLHYISLGGLILSIFGFLLNSTGPDTTVTALNSIGTLLILTMPIVGLAGLTLDLAYIKQAETDWNPSILLGLTGALFVWMLYAPYYTYKRWKHVGL